MSLTILKWPKGIRNKGLWIVSLGFANLLLILAAAIMLKEFPAKDDVGLRYVILRYDDYRLSNEHAERYLQERQLLNFALINNLKMSIAVIPGDTHDEIPDEGPRPSRVQPLIDGLRAGLFEVCLHGYQHTNNAVAWAPSEFSGVPLPTQKAWIDNGKRRLESLTGAKVKVFVPPFNGWDQNTLIALKDSGFSILSAEAGKFPSVNLFKYFPYTVTPKELQYLLATNKLGRSKLIVVNIHPFDLPEHTNRIGFTNLTRLLKEIKHLDGRFELVSFEDAVAKRLLFTHSELLNLSKMLSDIRFWGNLPLSSFLIRTSSLSASRPYYSSSILYSLQLFLGLSLFIIGFLISQVLGEKVKAKVVVYSIIFLLGAAAFVMALKSYEYLNYGQVIAAKRYSGIFLTSGMLVGFFAQTLGLVKSR